MVNNVGRGTSKVLETRAKCLQKGAQWAVYWVWLGIRHTYDGSSSPVWLARHAIVLDHDGGGIEGAGPAQERA